MEEEKETVEVTEPNDSKEIEVLQAEILELEKEIEELDKKFLEDREVQAKSFDKSLDKVSQVVSDNSEHITKTSEQVKTLSERVLNLNDLMTQQLAVDPETYTYSVEVSQEQIDKLKNKEKEYIEYASIYSSVFIAILLAYVGIKGAFSQWKA